MDSFKVSAMSEPYKYGFFPAQLDGRTASGCAFYFHSRSGCWQLWLGSESDPANYPGWSSPGELVDAGDYELINSDSIDLLLTELLGDGWVEDYEDYLDNCHNCDLASTAASALGSCVNCMDSRPIETIELPDFS